MLIYQHQRTGSGQQAAANSDRQGRRQATAKAAATATATAKYCPYTANAGQKLEEESFNQSTSLVGGQRGTSGKERVG